MIDDNELTSTLQKVANEYPGSIATGQLIDIPRIQFNIKAGLNAVTDQPSVNNLDICDLGGGLGLFSVGCAALGFNRTVLMDDFNDPVNNRYGDDIFSIHKRHGVEIIARDLVANGMGNDIGQFDIITSFDSMEHWHNSPKILLKEVYETLRPGGVFVLGVPNCVNLRKRMTVPLGYGKWSSMEEWYEMDTFRGHVREPDVSDLRYIAADMGLTDIAIYGRNWQGYRSNSKLINTLTKMIDFPLRLAPSLCSDIYLVGKKS